MTAAASNRTAAVGDRQPELVAAARDMVDGKRAMLPTALHVTALMLELERTERHLREAHQDLAIAGARIGQANDERLSVQDDLREAQQLLEEYEDMGVHVHIDWVAKTFRVERHYRRGFLTFTSWTAAVEFVRELRTQITAIGRAISTDQPQRATGAGD